MCMYVYVCVCVYVCAYVCDCEGWSGGISIQILSGKRKGDSITARLFFKEIHRRKKHFLTYLPWRLRWTPSVKRHSHGSPWESIVDHHSLFLPLWSRKVQGLLLAGQSSREMKEAAPRYKGHGSGVRSNLRHVQSFHRGHKDDLLRDETRLKKGERRGKEGCCVVNGGGVTEDRVQPEKAQTTTEGTKLFTSFLLMHEIRQALIFWSECCVFHFQITKTVSLILLSLFRYT